MKAPINSFVDVIKTVPGPNNESLSTIVLPNNAIHMMIHKGDGIFMKTGSAPGNSMSGNWLCGHLTGRKSFFIPARSHTVVIKFKPWASSLIFGLNLPDLINQDVNLNEFVPPEILLPFESDRLSIESKLNSVLGHFQNRVNERSVSPGIVNIIHQIETRHGNIRVNDLADRIGYSRRHLERKFKDLTGITIKKFINNTRFQYALNLLRQNSPHAEIVYMCGYFDQTHFIDEFRNITGVTPGKFIKNDLTSIYNL
jgi:AraC-like DNA-binding protein